MQSTGDVADDVGAPSGTGADLMSGSECRDTEMWGNIVATLQTLDVDVMVVRNSFGIVVIGTKFSPVRMSFIPTWTSLSKKNSPSFSYGLNNLYVLIQVICCQFIK